MQLVLATNNNDKIVEIRQLLEDLPITLLTRSDFLSFPDPDETGSTLLQNAAIKAKTIFEFCGVPSLADDSGLAVDALGGRPGVYSSRFAGEAASYADNCNKLLRLMAGVPKEQRSARFQSVIAIAWSADEIEFAEGTCEGLICETADGSGGFGYDPVFFHPPTGKRFSELHVAEKNGVSHRGEALRQARRLILRRLQLNIP